MIKTIFCVVLLAFAMAFKPFKAMQIKTKAEPTINKAEQKKMYALLNKIRANKKLYELNYKIDPQLKITKTALKYNKFLEKAAEEKALDMANRNYFNHINPDGYAMNHFINKNGYTLQANYLKNINLNYFESIGAGSTTGTEMLKMLIIDDGVPSMAHRNHLLGVAPFNNTLKDIGIGFVNTNNEENSFITYCCILIAKH